MESRPLTKQGRLGTLGVRRRLRKIGRTASKEGLL